ncbi:MAG: DUF2975 domain-containing protein [Opitutales bacterium]
MKLNLAGKLRTLFGFLRGCVVFVAAVAMLVVTVKLWMLLSHSDNRPDISVTMDGVRLGIPPDTIELKSDRSNPGDLVLEDLAGSVKVNLFSKDTRLVNALVWTVFPGAMLGFAYYFLLFGLLRNVCANIEQGELFSERNVRMVRRMGLLLIGFGLFNVFSSLIYAQVIGRYFDQHVTLAGIKASIHMLTKWSDQPITVIGPGSIWERIVTGCIVLLISEAFRQGLALKTESELTV